MSYNRGRHSRVTYATVEEGPVNTQVSLFRLFYQTWPRGGSLEVAVDEGEPIELSTQSEEVRDQVFDLRVNEAPHSFEVRALEGPLRLYGAVLERRGPGVVVDGLMLIGARARRLALFNGEHLGRQVAQRETDLLIFWMGGNDAESGYFDEEGFVADYTAGIAHARQGRPEASCLVASNMDLGESPGGFTRRRVPRMVELERQIALDRGCAFFNFFQAMGGEGSSRRWYRSSPRLISGDYLHPTREGAGEVARIFYQTLLRGLAGYLGIAPASDESASINDVLNPISRGPSG